MFRFFLDCFRVPAPNPQVSIVDTETEFHLILVAAYKQFTIDVTSELLGTKINDNDARFKDIDPYSDEFMNDVKELLDSTKELQVDEDKPLTYRLLKQIETNLALNKKRSVLRSFYQLKQRSKETSKSIGMDVNGNFKLCE